MATDSVAKGRSFAGGLETTAGAAHAVAGVIQGPTVNGAPSDLVLQGCRRRFENGEATLAAIAIELGVPPRRLTAIRKEQQWLAPVRRPASGRVSKQDNAAAARRARVKRPGDPVSIQSATDAAAPAVTPAQRRPKLVARLWAAAERHMGEIEAALADAPGDAVSREREAKLMAMLVRVAAGLAALDRSAAADDPADKGAQVDKGSAGKGGIDDASAGLPDDIDGFRRALEDRIIALRQRGASD